MYRWLDEPRPSSDLGAWETITGEFSLVVGYTYFGDFLLRHPKTREFAFLTTLSAEFIDLGYDEITLLEADFLMDKGVIDQVLRPADVSFLENKLGVLLANEIFIPVPYPFLGGSGEIDTYQK
jgi:hypothetical protein